MNTFLNTIKTSLFRKTPEYNFYNHLRAVKEVVENQENSKKRLIVANMLLSTCVLEFFLFLTKFPLEFKLVMGFVGGMTVSLISFVTKKFEFLFGKKLITSQQQQCFYEKVFTSQLNSLEFQHGLLLFLQSILEQVKTIPSLQDHEVTLNNLLLDIKLSFAQNHDINSLAFITDNYDYIINLINTIDEHITKHKYLMNYNHELTEYIGKNGLTPILNNTVEEEKEFQLKSLL
jgi:hypothetical protein